MPRQRHTAPPRRATGFTLIELLMVVLIISILVGMLMPVVIQVMKYMAATKTQQRVVGLAAGAVSFFKDNAFYPGQIDMPDIPGTPPVPWGGSGTENTGYNNLKTRLNKAPADPDFLTGSQVLARALFCDVEGTGFPKSNYAQFQRDDTLPWYDRTTIDGKKRVQIGDCWGKGQAMPICYYPARIGVTGFNMYVEADNSPYTVGHIAAGSAFNKAIKHPAFDEPVKMKQFLILGAGLDRAYFNGDDANNFGGQ